MKQTGRDRRLLGRPRIRRVPAVPEPPATNNAGDQPARQINRTSLRQLVRRAKLSASQKRPVEQSPPPDAGTQHPTNRALYHNPSRRSCQGSRISAFPRTRPGTRDPVSTARPGGDHSPLLRSRPALTATPSVKRTASLNCIRVKRLSSHHPAIRDPYPHGLLPRAPHRRRSPRDGAGARFASRAAGG